jgi:hypothetical protein
MRKPSLIRVIRLRLLLIGVAIVASGALAYLYEKVPLAGTGQLLVIVLFYTFLCAWPCLLVSTIVRTLHYLYLSR